MNSNFINCSFNSNILIADGIAKIQHLDEKPFGVTYNLTFDNCEFKDFSIEKSIFTIYKYGKVVLTNCTLATLLIKTEFTCMIVASPTVILRVLWTFLAILR